MIEEDVESYNMRRTVENTRWAASQLNREEILQANELLAALRVVHPDQTFLTTTVAGLFGNEAASRAAEENAANSIQKIQQLADERGYPIQWSNDIGAASLEAFWQDPDFDPGVAAFYYLRALQIPTPRHSQLDAIALGLDEAKEGPKVIQERAYSSPIWYRP